MWIVIPSTLVVIAIALPLVYLFIRTVGIGSELYDILFRIRTFEILFRSLALVVAVSCTSILIAIPLAWLTVKTDMPFRGIFSVITILPLVIPSYVGGFVFIAVLGPNGILQEWLEPFGVERLPNLYGFPGAMLTLTFITYPYVLLPVRAALIRLDRSLDESSRSLGKSYITTFMSVTLPMIRPAIAAGALLVGLYTLSDFGAVSLLHYETFTWAIYVQYGSFARDIASGLSLILAGIAFGIIVLEGRARGTGANYHTTTGVPRPQTVIKLGFWRWPSVILCTTVVSMSVLVPTLALVYWTKLDMLSEESLATLGIHLWNTLHVSGLASIITVCAAIPIAALSIRYASYISSIIEKLSYIGFALPGIVVALAMVFFGIHYATPFYQTISILVFAYLVLFLPGALGNIRNSFLQISPSIEESARSLGHSPFQVFRTITLPLLKTGILAGLVMVFLLTMKELPATLILSPIGFQTLATSIWSATEDGFFATASTSALMLVLAASIPTFIVAWIGRR